MFRPRSALYLGCTLLALGAGQFPRCVEAGDNPPPLHEQIDAAIGQRLAEQGIVPAETSSDAEFLRRIHLDLTGIIPAPAEARAFLQDTSPDKRRRLIDALLSSPDYAIHMARVFDVMLTERRIPTIASYDVPSAEWRRYLTRALAENRPWDEMVREILASDGTEGPHAAGVKFYLVRNVAPHPLTRDVGRIFLGADLQCAQCHDDPRIEGYRQKDYYGIYAFLERLTPYRDSKKNRSLVGEKAGGETTFVSVFTAADGKTYPRLPGGEMIPDPPVEEGQEYVVKPGPDARGVPTYSRRRKLAELLPRPETEGFTRNIANRLWAMMMGRGIVHPLDLHHADNPPSHPELLRRLEEWLVAHQYDIRGLLREIALSQAYQRSSVLPDGASEPPANTYAVAPLRGLSAEQLSWSLLRALGRVERFEPSAEAPEQGAPPASEDSPAWEVRLESLQPLEKQAQSLIAVFAGLPGQPDGSFQPVVDQALYLLNNPTTLSLIQDPPSTLLSRLASIENVEQLTEELYLSVLSRRPDGAEVDGVRETLPSAGTAEERREALTALVWGLLLSSEFRINH